MGSRALPDGTTRTWRPAHAVRGSVVLGLAIALLLVALGAASASSLALAWAWWRYPLPEPQSIPTVRLMAGSEELAVYQGGGRRSQIWTPLAEIPPHVVDAVLTAEDRRFFEHPGIDLRASVRAAIVNVRSGSVAQGASTITQQLARTLYLDTARSWTRKLREAGIALLLEHRYGKEQILEAYLNTVYMGHDGEVEVHGIAAAARDFLGKKLTALTLDEAALLAAAIRAPNRVLWGHSGRSLERRDELVRAMSAQGLVTAAAARDAMARPIRRVPRPARDLAPYFVHVARDEIVRRLPSTPGEVRIETSLDPELQRVATRAVREGLDRLERRRSDPAASRLQAALVAIEPASGEIRALVGGRRYQESQFNRAVMAARQPGSLFKPIVYLAAFEAGRAGPIAPITPASLIPDEPIEIQSGKATWAPNNMSGRYEGPVTVRHAIEQSLNVPVVRLAQDLGLTPVTRVARALGIASPLAVVPSLALGTSEVTLLEITAAFATIANEGVRVAPTALSARAAGGLPSLAPASPATQAVSPESAFLITHLLRGVVRHGTAAASSRWGLSEITAGKTGTTEDLRDSWFVGYTPDLVIGVWVGTDDSTSTGLTGSEGALPIWATVMQAAVKRTAPRPFVAPPGIVMAPVERGTGRRASLWCGGGPVVTEAFRVGTEPQSDCRPIETATSPMETATSWWRGLVQVFAR
jgi:1A family penicillin-binding protein